MKFLTLIIGLTFLITLSIRLYANTTIQIQCAHQEICGIIQNIIEQNKKELTHSQIKFELQTLFHISGDPHDYEPSMNEIKIFLKSQNIILGPAALHPWLENKIKNHLIQNKNFQKYLFRVDFLESTLNDFAKIGQKNKEALAHFWIYPMIYCDFAQQLLKHLNLLSEITKRNLTLGYTCSSKQIEQELKIALKNTQLPMVLTHDALLPLIKYVQRDIPTEQQLVVLNLKSSHHHDEIDARKIKQFENLQKKNKNILFIIEKEMILPSSIKSKIRPTDKIIEIGVEETKKYQPFFVLEQFITEINSVNREK